MAALKKSSKTSKSKKSTPPKKGQKKTKKAKKISKSVSKKPKATKSKKSEAKTVKWESRAVKRLIEPGSSVECPKCREPIRFKARQRDSQVICNIYEKSKWVRVDHYHEECYKESGKPYGAAQSKNKTG